MPRYKTGACVVQDNTPVMVKIYSTLGRKFNKKDLEDAQRMGQELVCCFHTMLLCVCQSCEKYMLKLHH